MRQDLEHGGVKIRYIKGYPSLAAFIASDSDRSTSIYRRFDRLSARNLLYLQSELVELESRQDRLDAADLKRTTDEKMSASNWEIFKERAERTAQEKERMEVVKEIREKLKEYSLCSGVCLPIRTLTREFRRSYFAREYFALIGPTI